VIKRLYRRNGYCYSYGIMRRQWRIEYEGALYHVLFRGNEGRSIFWMMKTVLSFLSLNRSRVRIKRRDTGRKFRSTPERESGYLRTCGIGDFSGVK